MDIFNFFNGQDNKGCYHPHALKISTNERFKRNVYVKRITSFKVYNAINL